MNPVVPSGSRCCLRAGPPLPAGPIIATLVATGVAAVIGKIVAKVIAASVAFALGLAAAALPLPAAAALKPGDPAPDFTIDATLAGQPFRFALAEALARGPVVLYFYPKAFTQGCTIEANAFAEASDDYAALGASVIGVSGDDIATLNRFSVEACRSRFAVGSDAGGRVMADYDARMPYSDGYARRISYVISPQRRILHVHASGSPEGHVPQTLAALRRWRAANPPG